MPVFADAEHWTFRGGPETTEYGKPYLRSAQGQVQADRWMYLYNIRPNLPLDEYRDTIRLVRYFAKYFDWKGIFFHREKNGVTVKVRIPIKPAKRLNGHHSNATPVAGHCGVADISGNGHLGGLEASGLLLSSQPKET